MTMHILISTLLFFIAFSLTMSHVMQIIIGLARIQFHLMNDPKSDWKYNFGQIHFVDGALWTAFFWHFITFVR